MFSLFFLNLQNLSDTLKNRDNEFWTFTPRWVTGLDILDGLRQGTLTSPEKLIGIILKQKLQSQIRRNLEGILRLPIATGEAKGTT